MIRLSAWPQKSPTMNWYELQWPTLLEVKSVQTWFSALCGYSHSCGIQFVVHAKCQSVRFYIAVPRPMSASAIGQLQHFLPDIETVKQRRPVFRIQQLVELRVLRQPFLPLLNPELPINYSLLGSLTQLRMGEEVVISTILHSRRKGRTTLPAKQFRHTGWGGMLLEALWRGPQSLNSQTQRAVQRYIQDAGWRIKVKIGITAAHTSRYARLIEQLVGAWRVAVQHNVRLGVKVMSPAIWTQVSKLWTPRISVSFQELSQLLAWPYGEHEFSGVSRVRSKYVPAALHTLGTDRVIAVTAEKQRPTIHIATKDALLHTHVLGPTGVGKSAVLLNLAVQDMAENRGVIVVDPKGDLISELLVRIPMHRQSDVIILDPNDASRPVGLNPLANSQRPTALVADDILSIFHRLYGSLFGPRTQDILHAGLLTLGTVPDMSLSVLPILFTNPAFRYRLISQIHDPLGLSSFWSWYDSLSDAERLNVTAPLMNKLRAFLLRPAMRRVIGQSHPKFDMNDVFTKHKILLVNLAKGTLGSETSQLFGSLVISQIWQTIQQRINQPPESRSPVFVYIDEMQDYLNLPIPIEEILAQSRSYGVGMVLAHQHLNQLPSELRSGVMTNARNRICFQLDHDDAVTMAKSATKLDPSDFEHLARFQVYARLVAKGSIMPWCSGTTLPPVEPTNDGRKLIELSRRRYGRDAADIETALGGLIAGQPNPRRLSLDGIGRQHQYRQEQ